MEGGTKVSAEQLERELGELLDRETFAPPEEFAGSALISRRVGLRRGGARPRGLVGEAG